MEVANIEITKLYVSNINVRKTLTRSGRPLEGVEADENQQEGG